MALIRVFHARDDGKGNVETYSLARDVTNDRVFILRTQAFEAAKRVPDVETKLSIESFLNATGPAQGAFLELIGTLVPEA